VKEEIWAKAQPVDIFAVIEATNEWRAVHLTAVKPYRDQQEIYRVAGSELIVRSISILATFDSLAVAESALARAQTLEKQLRPLWQKAVEHELATRHAMMDAVVLELRRDL
jgi:hypothetical protein